jgi:O-antigen ligase
MVVNNLRDRVHARRLVVAALVTAGIVSVIGLTQIPSGERVSAPFEGEAGEPNTFGGYLLLMMAIAAGIALETTSFKVRVRLLGLLALMALPFAFTLSRASYLGVVPAFLALTALTTRRRAMVAVLLLVLVCSPLLMVLAPASIVNRVAYTFQPEAHQPTVHIGKVGLDPSTSARLLSLRQALEGWTERPILGWGVTGFGFMDAQYARVLVETGVIGFAVFVWLLWSVLRATRSAHARLVDPLDRGLAMGFIAGTVGLLAHAIGSNTFTIIRIMEPFWLFAGIVVMLPVLAAEESRAAPVPLTPAAAPVLR